MTSWSEALKAPCRQIADNAGEDGEVVVDQILKNKNPAYGYNAATDEYGDMFKFGVIDPTKVAKTALQNAASVSALGIDDRCVDHRIEGKEGRGSPRHRRRSSVIAPSDAKIEARR